MVVKLSAYGLVGGRKPSRNDLAHCVKGDLGLRQLSSERLDHTWRWGTARGSTGANDGSFICLPLGQRGQLVLILRSWHRTTIALGKGSLLV